MRPAGIALLEAARHKLRTDAREEAMKKRIRMPNLSDRMMVERERWRQLGLRRDQRAVAMSAWRLEQLELLRRRQISWQDYFRASARNCLRADHTQCAIFRSG